MKHILLLIIFLLSSFFIYSQSVRLYGIVTDADNKEGLFAVNITIKSKNKEDKVQLGTSTDLQGNYEIKLGPGSYTIKYNFVGYAVYEEQITLSNNETSKKLDVVLRQHAEIIDEVVVSAGKYEQKLSELTVSMEVLKPKAIENNNTYNVESILNQLSGVDINDEQPSIRASSGWSYGAGSRVLILMDDLPLMSADVGDAKWNYIPIENISQVEVLKGASSALFGSQALGGVINVRSAYPTEKSQTKINYFYGSYGTPAKETLKWWGQNFYSNKFNKPTVLLRDQLLYWVKNPMYGGVSFSHSQQFGNLDLIIGGNHFIDESYRDIEYEKRTRVNANVRYRSKYVEGLAFGVNSNFMAIDCSDFFMWSSDSTAFQSLKGGSGASTIAPTHGLRMNIDPFITYYKPNGSKYSLRTRWFSTENKIVGDSMKNNNSDILYGEFQYQTLLREKWSLTAGFVEAYSVVKSLMFGDHYSNNMALYSQLDLRLGLLKFSLGVRGEYYVVDSTQTESIIDIKFGKNIIEIPIKPVIRAGINYQLSEATFLRLSYGQGYRFPAISEKYTSLSLGLVNVVPNPRLKPETGWNVETGIKQGYRFGKWKGFADMAIYYQRYNNMMEFAFGIFDTINYAPDYNGQIMGFQCDNLDNVQIVGLDISATITRMVKNTEVLFLLGYNYNDPKYMYTDTTTSSISPTLKYRYKHSIKADFSVETKRISTGINFIWKSPMINVDRLFCDERDVATNPEVEFYKLISGIIMPKYFEYWQENKNRTFTNIDIHFGFKFREELKISFLVKNLLNQIYVGRPGDMCEPRRYELALSAKF